MIIILISIVIVLLVLGGISLHYRAIMGEEELSLDEQEEKLKNKQSKPQPKTDKEIIMDEGHSFFVKMDAHLNKERPFTDSDFDHYALIKFMGVSQETFCKLVPRYKEPERTKDYINSLRAEYAAKILMEHSDNDIASKCGFKNTATFNSAFKFSFGITPTEYVHSISQMFKKKLT